jgi:D-alanyl-D-alanine carboxypeptidase
LSPGKKSARTRRISVRNHNRLLWNYDGALGGKTGYTFAAQKCYVGAVERNGVTLIVSLLGSRDLWGDTKRLLEYGFDNYQALNTLTPAVARSITAQRATPDAAKLSALVVMPQEESAPKSSTDGYVLQVGSFREQHRAEGLVRAFSEKGFDAFVEKTTISDKGETSYRVRIGPYAELSEAQEILQEVLKESGHRAIVLPYSIIPENEAVGSQIDPAL